MTTITQANTRKRVSNKTMPCSMIPPLEMLDIFGTSRNLKQSIQDSRQRLHQARTRRMTVAQSPRQRLEYLKRLKKALNATAL